MTHTKTPWMELINGKGEVLIVAEHSEHDVAYIGDMEGTCGECHANAEFIVRACNAHDVLVGALKKIYAISIYESEVVSGIAKEALAKARK